jgi:hypothetical protein
MELGPSQDIMFNLWHISPRLCLSVPTATPALWIPDDRTVLECVVIPRAIRAMDDQPLSLDLGKAPYSRAIGLGDNCLPWYHLVHPWIGPPGPVAPAINMHKTLAPG